MQELWFGEKDPADGQLINWTFNGNTSDPARERAGRPYAGPYRSVGRYNAKLNIVVCADLKVFEVDDCFAWHPITPGAVFTRASLT